MGTPFNLKRIGGLAAGAVLLLAACGDDSDDGSDDSSDGGDESSQVENEETDGQETAAPAEDGKANQGTPTLRRSAPSLRSASADAPSADAPEAESTGAEAPAGGDVPDPVELPEPSGDEALDQLAQECHDGDMEACDQLYLDSELGSELEAYADSCAGRQELNTGRWCVDVFGGGSGGGPVDAEAADIDSLIADCEAGDMVACDDLFNAAEPGSEEQILGDTCAGRQPVGTGQWCVDSFGDQTDEPADQISDSAPVSDIFGEDFDPDEFNLEGFIDSLEVEEFDVEEFLDELSNELSEEHGIDVDLGPNDGVAQQVPDTPIDVSSEDPTEIPQTSGDQTIDGYAQECHDGDMQACDDLYFETELGSELEAYGDTCAGRQPEHTGRLCVNVFA